MNEVREWAPLAFVILAALAYLLATYRRSHSDEAALTMDAQEKRIDLLESQLDDEKGAVATLRAELGDAREKCAQDIGQLQGENTLLKSLVMGETLPPAYKEALRETIHDINTEADERTRAAVGEVNETLARIEQGVTRLLVEGPQQEGVRA